MSIFVSQPIYLTLVVRQPQNFINGLVVSFGCNYKLGLVNTVHNVDCGKVTLDMALISWGSHVNNCLLRSISIPLFNHHSD